MIFTLFLKISLNYFPFMVENENNNVPQIFCYCLWTTEFFAWIRIRIGNWYGSGSISVLGKKSGSGSLINVCGSETLRLSKWLHHTTVSPLQFTLYCIYIVAYSTIYTAEHSHGKRGILFTQVFFLFTQINRMIWPKRLQQQNSRAQQIGKRYGSTGTYNRVLGFHGSGTYLYSFTSVFKN